MRRMVAAVLIAFALRGFAADEFPLKLNVLVTSESRREYKKIHPDPCITMALGVPCRDYEYSKSIPQWAVDVLQVSGRVTQRGRTMEYDLVCKSSPPKRRCAPMKIGEYPARWNGKRLEVLVTDGAGKSTINRFQIKGERGADVN